MPTTTNTNEPNNHPIPTPPPSPLIVTTHFATPPQQTWDLHLAPLQNQGQSTDSPKAEEGNETHPRLPSVAPLLAEADSISQRSHQNGSGDAAFNTLNRSPDAVRAETANDSASSITLGRTPDQQISAPERATSDTPTDDAHATLQNAFDSMHGRCETRSRTIYDSVAGEEISPGHFDARWASVGLRVVAGRLVGDVEDGLRRLRLHLAGCSAEEVEERAPKRRRI